MRASRPASPDSRSGAGALTYSSRGSPPDSSNSSSRPETRAPGASCPYRCQYSPMNTSLCARYCWYTSRGGYGRAPSSNITGVSRSAEIARDSSPLLGQLAQRGTHEHPQPPVRSPDDRLIRRTRASRSPLIRVHHASLQPAAPASNSPGEHAFFERESDNDLLSQPGTTAPHFERKPDARQHAIF